MPGAVVTGAGAGLGAEIVRRLARRGFTVHVTDIDGDAAARTAADVAAGCYATQLDVRDAEATRAVAARTAEQDGLALWVNNAGVLRTGPLWQHSPDLWRELLEVNALGTLHGMTAALEHMRPAQRGAIINVASLASLTPVPGEAVYAATKHAVLGLSLSTIADLRLAGERDISISCVCPDGMWTPMLYDKLDDPGAAMSFSGTLLQPEQVADAVERLVDHPQPILSTPRWRGAIARVPSLLPRLSSGSLGVTHRLGQWQQSRLRRAHARGKL
ncbi:SDR family NAD(P)-dependent oxidoreductase [Flexivirga meconopsidis]|uniref:SDR family NAD(P)-dependent oxidoreductase n=1 Tax=Flexivirga meconopsidis TaxID=2977121 RepID=UPI00223FB504|nr:SDR family oxidoreductase [Flexivirga meconopsidis]